MTFLSPQLLWALLLVPALAVGYLALARRRTRYAIRFTNVDLLANVVAESPRWRRWVPPVLFLAALGALLFATARPQLVTKAPRNQASVVLAMDVSGSMRATDVEPTRLEAAENAAGRFLEQVPEKFQVGLITFSSEAQVAVPPTDDHTLVRQALSGLEADGGTAIGDAVALATELHKKRLIGNRQEDNEDVEPPLVVLLLSDGAPSEDTLDPVEAANRAKAAGVPVYTIALGTDEGTIEVANELGIPETIDVPPDRETLEKIARITGGATFSAPTPQALEAVYERLGTSIGYEEEKHEVTAWFAAGGLVLLVLAGSLSALWFNRLP
jgi:Ca-activated chloride channel family protein